MHKAISMTGKLNTILLMLLVGAALHGCGSGSTKPDMGDRTRSEKSLPAVQKDSLLPAVQNNLPAVQKDNLLPAVQINLPAVQNSLPAVQKTTP